MSSSWYFFTFLFLVSFCLLRKSTVAACYSASPSRFMAFFLFDSGPISLFFFCLTVSFFVFWGDGQCSQIFTCFLLHLTLIFPSSGHTFSSTQASFIFVTENRSSHDLLFPQSSNPPCVVVFSSVEILFHPI